MRCGLVIIAVYFVFCSALPDHPLEQRRRAVARPRVFNHHHELQVSIANSDATPPELDDSQPSVSNKKNAVNKLFLSLFYVSVAIVCNFSTWLDSAFLILSTITLILLLNVIFSNPGYITVKNRYKVASSDNAQGRLCLSCRIQKPPRCHHCRRCDRCVDVMDHHCPYLGNCIGRGNLGRYRAMIAAGATAGARGLYLGRRCRRRPSWLPSAASPSWLPLPPLPPRVELWGDKEFWKCFLVSIFSLYLGGFALSLIFIQAYGFLTNTTTIERWLSRKGTKDYVLSVAVVGE